jgi:putative SbcD/Mre11-related phosphoesterase
VKFIYFLFPNILVRIEIFDLGLYICDLRILVIADLHIGHEASLEKQGILLPLSTYPRMKRKLLNMIDEVDVDELIILGDVKTEFGRPSIQEWIEVKDLLNTLKNRLRIRVVRGNHDNYILNILSKFSIDFHYPYFKLGDTVFIHGHEPLPHEAEDAEVIVMAHEHPAVTLRDRLGVKFKFKCFLRGDYKGKELMVIPAFSPLATGASINEAGREELLSPILQIIDIGELTPIVFEDGEVFELPKIKHLNSYRRES